MKGIEMTDREDVPLSESMARAFSRCETDDAEGVGVVGGRVVGCFGDFVPASEAQLARTFLEVEINRKIR
jgi:hypothetical protein